MKFNREKILRILGKNQYQPTNKYVCFFPFRGEFGWYVMSHVKRIHGYNHPNKIVCARPGHECLFPSAKHFFYAWRDYHDNIKNGILMNYDDNEIKRQIITMMDTDDICFISPSDISWEEKMALYNYTFIPKSIHNIGLKTDIVITPRKRNVDAHRNWKQEYWQYLVDQLTDLNFSVGVCGTRETSFDLNNILFKSHDYVDVDSDIELLNNAKIVITQESGLQYLSFLCERPTLCIDHYHRDFGADLHRKLSIPFKDIPYVWSNYKALVEEVILFMKEIYDSNL